MALLIYLEKDLSKKILHNYKLLNEKISKDLVVTSFLAGDKKKYNILKNIKITLACGNPDFSRIKSINNSKT